MTTTTKDISTAPSSGSASTKLTAPAPSRSRRIGCRMTSQACCSRFRFFSVGSSLGPSSARRRAACTPVRPDNRAMSSMVSISHPPPHRHALCPPTPNPAEHQQSAITATMRNRGTRRGALRPDERVSHRPEPARESLRRSRAPRHRRSSRSWRLSAPGRGPGHGGPVPVTRGSPRPVRGPSGGRGPRSRRARRLPARR